VIITYHAASDAICQGYW